MFNINHILQRLIKSSINSDIWNNGELELLKVWLNGFGALDLFALSRLPDRSTDSISCLEGSNENLESNVASCASDLITIRKSN
jgi:hypothetical protein